MYQFLLLGLFFLGFIQQIYAQKIRSEQLLVNYTQLPLKPLPENIKTYYTEIKSSFLSPQQTESYRTRYLKLEGYEEVSRDEDLTISVDFDRMVVSSEDIVSTWNPKRPDEPRYFYYKISYTLPSQFAVITRDGKEIYYDEGGCGQVYFYEFGRNAQFKEEKELHQAYEKKRTELSEREEDNAIQNILRSINTLIADEIAFTKKSTKFHVAIVKGKYNYSDLEDALGYMEEGFGVISRKEEAQKANAYFEKAIQIWQKALQESNLNDKKARINAQISSRLYYNCALAYLWMTDFKNAMHYAELSEQNKVGFSFRGVWNVPIKSMIRDKKRRFEANQ